MDTAKRSLGFSGALTTALVAWVLGDPGKTADAVHTFIAEVVIYHQTAVMIALLVFGFANVNVNAIRKTYPNEVTRPTWVSYALNLLDPVSLNFWRLRTGRVPGSSVEIPKARGTA